ncbi:hypothetical protein L7F22_043842 [Adiantum nelumboides]|nr:hypothetical protein [Adiantum nelumboides]
MSFEVLDLRKYNLPFFDEESSNLRAPSKNPYAIKWQKDLAKFDGFVFVVAEYNRSLPASLKNALDQAYREWMHKPFTAIAYSGSGGARTLEHLRTIAMELHMVSTRSAVHIGGSDFMEIYPNFAGKSIKSIEARLLPSCNSALNELKWWLSATMHQRSEEAEQGK